MAIVEEIKSDPHLMYSYKKYPHTIDMVHHKKLTINTAKQLQNLKFSDCFLLFFICFEFLLLHDGGQILAHCGVIFFSLFLVMLLLLRENVPCIDASGADIYLNRDDMKKAIYVDEVSTERTICSDILSPIPVILFVLIGIITFGLIKIIWICM